MKTGLQSRAGVLVIPSEKPLAFLSANPLVRLIPSIPSPTPAMFPLVQARQFFKEWHASQLPEPDDGAGFARMRAFFEVWKSRLPDSPPNHPTEAFNCQQFASFTAAFSPAYRAYRRTGIGANAWRAAGVGKDETRNSAVLRWLLDGFEDHGQGSAILVAMLQELKRTELARLASVQPYWTRVETCPLGDQESRIDIEIEGPGFLIFIEVKIQAGETGNQLERYLALAEAKAAAEQKPWALIFLTPTGRQAASANLHDKIIPFSWKQLAGIVDEHVRKEGLSTTPAGTLLLHYATHARTLR